MSPGLALRRSIKAARKKISHQALLHARPVFAVRVTVHNTSRSHRHAGFSRMSADLGLLLSVSFSAYQKQEEEDSWHIRHHLVESGL